MTLDTESQQLLLTLARRAIAEGLESGCPPVPQGLYSPLDQPGASFITLTREGRLRGCCGVLEAIRPLGADVVHNAFRTAVADPRFSPVRMPELSVLRIEIAVLSPLEPVVAATVEDLLATLRPGKDGLVVACGRQRATLLPKVWNSLPEPRSFLAALLRKSGLPADLWSPGLRFYRYQATSFAET